ncbi:hypothetical protein MTP99_006647 [Tenebrio molitor]|nr:hypothetical protein MTP99_006647 [Tenebrio molitor]
MDLQTVQSMDWLFKKERFYLLVQFWQQRATLAEKEVTTLKEQIANNTTNNCENKEGSNMDRQTFENEIAAKDKEPINMKSTKSGMLLINGRARKILKRRRRKESQARETGQSPKIVLEIRINPRSFIGIENKQIPRHVDRKWFEYVETELDPDLILAVLLKLYG